MNAANHNESLNGQTTHHDKVVDGGLPLAPTAVDFIARAQAIWGDKPDGSSLSALVDQNRGSDHQSSAEKMLEILALAPRVEPEEHERID
jgi:hypothetical protein